MLMAKKENRRLKPSVLAEDEAAFNALQKIKDYSPANADHSVEAVTQEINEMRAKRAVEDQITAAGLTARDETVAQEWKVHNTMLGVKDSVKAQFGKDSVQVQEIGLKRVSEYKTRRPTTKAPK
jgi:hypothetical protein